jgi:hypothetical protein
MATYLISILAALAVVIIIIVFGLILTQLFINRANKAQTCANLIPGQSQGVFVDMDDLPEAKYDPGIAIISNDVIEGTPHRHRHLMKKTVSVIDQDAQIDHTNNKYTITGQIYAYKSLTIPTKTDTNKISSDTSIVNPLTDKITLEY